MAQFFQFSSIKDFSEKVFETAEAARKSTKNSFRVAASGGSAARFFDILKTNSFDFSRTELWEVDERLVPQAHSDSNFRLLYEKIGNKVKAFHYFDTKLTSKISAEKYTETLDLDTNGNYFDLTILGVGPDGHTASIFPETDLLQLKNKLAVHTTTDRFAVRDRLTLTFEVLEKSAQILVLLFGKEKAEIWEKISSFSENLPIDHIKKLPHAKFLWLKFD